MINYYQLLDLPEGITHKEVRFAFEHFKEELKKFSPGIDIDDEELRSRKPKEWDAYKVLLSPDARKEHDYYLQKERERIQQEFERKNKLVISEGESRSSNKAGSIFFLAFIIVVSLYWGITKMLKKPVAPAVWQTYHINNEMKILLPAKTDTLPNLIPPYLTNYINRSVSLRSELENGFCVTIAIIDMNEHFKVPLKDLKYITSMESQNPHLRSASKMGEEINGSYKGYKMTIAKTSYQNDNVVRVCENYTLLKDLTAIKIIVNYNPGDPLQEKYNEIVFKSIN